jgi:hypothetical protein
MIAGLLLASCVHEVLRTSEMSPPLSRSLLNEIPPKTFAFQEFKDIRGNENPVRMMKLGRDTYDLEDPPATLVALWVRQELERNGHRVLPDSPAVKSDFIVQGTVYRFSVQRHVDLVSITWAAEIGVRLTISRVPADTGTLAKSYQGNHALTGVFVKGFWKTVINQALMAMIQEMSTDPELMAFLRR